jgi:hypothetical protein
MLRGIRNTNSKNPSPSRSFAILRHAVDEVADQAKKRLVHLSRNLAMMMPLDRLFFWVLRWSVHRCYACSRRFHASLPAHPPCHQKLIFHAVRGETQLVFGFPFPRLPRKLRLADPRDSQGGGGINEAD